MHAMKQIQFQSWQKRFLNVELKLNNAKYVSKTFLLKVLFIVFLSYVILSHISMMKSKVRKRIQPEEVIVHIDMKGAPPKLQYLKELAAIVKKDGATGLLLEYEDMFCYKGELAITNAPDCYSDAELEKFLTEAAAMGLTLIPLVQSLGHLEALLEKPKFENLAEALGDQSSICPSQAKSKELIRDRLEQVLELHNQIQPLKYIHIGCDEVWSLNICNVCKSRKLSNSEIYLKHLSFITDFIKKKYPDVSIMFWADMLDSIAEETLSQYDLRSLVPVNWNYHTKLEENVRSIEIQQRIFDNIWIASAYKGADGKSSVLPNTVNRFINNIAWMTCEVNQPKGNQKFGGIILTGWSRYNHFQPVCDPLPAALPSLTICLATVNFFKQNPNIAKADPKDIYNEHIMPIVSKKLKCDAKIYSTNHDFLSCSFYGFDFYRLLSLSVSKPGIQLFTVINASEVAQIVTKYYDAIQTITVGHVLVPRKMYGFK